MSYIGKQPVPQSLQSRQQFTGDGSTTTFTTIGGVELYEDVFLNGVRLSRVDNEYSFDGTTLTITPAPANGDTVSIILRNDHSELIALPITDSQGNNVLSESGGVVTLTADAAVIEGSSSGDLVRITQTGSGNALVVEDSANPDSTPFVVDASGNVGIGASSLTNKLTINTSAFGQVVDLQKSGTTYGSLILVAGYPGIAVGSIAGIAINPNQVALVPATSSGESDNTHDLGRSGIRWNECYLSNGTINGSDRNEKTEITTSELGLDFINKINPVSYKWNGRYRTHYGMVSQEIETLLSDLGKTSMDFAGFIKSPVTDEDGNETGEYRYGLRYTEFISPMIKAIQEQQALIESQQSQIDALTARIEALETT